MRCQVRIEDCGNARHETWDQVVSIDPSRALLARDETLMDIVLGELARMRPLSDNGSGVNSLLERFARDGTSNPSCIVPAEAVQVIYCPDYFSPSNLPVVRVLMAKRRVILPDGEALAFDDFCGSPPDRWEGPKHRRRQSTDHIFGYRHCFDGGEVHETDLECGSIMTGLFEALMPGPWGQASHEFATLAGILLGCRGDLFNGCVSGPARAGASGLAEMRSTFLAVGHVASSRAWMPPQMLPGRDFHLCRAAARSDLRDLGAALAPIAMKSKRSIERAAILHVLNEIGEDPVQFSLRDRNSVPASNHEALEMISLIRDISDVAGLDPAGLGAKRTG